MWPDSTASPVGIFHVASVSLVLKFRLTYFLGREESSAIEISVYLSNAGWDERRGKWYWHEKKGGGGLPVITNEKHPVERPKPCIMYQF